MSVETLSVLNDSRPAVCLTKTLLQYENLCTMKALRTMQTCAKCKIRSECKNDPFSLGKLTMWSCRACKTESERHCEPKMSSFTQKTRTREPSGEFGEWRQWRERLSNFTKRREPMAKIELWWTHDRLKLYGFRRGWSITTFSSWCSDDIWRVRVWDNVDAADCCSSLSVYRHECIRMFHSSRFSGLFGSFLTFRVIWSFDPRQSIDALGVIKKEPSRVRKIVTHKTTQTQWRKVRYSHRSPVRHKVKSSPC